MGEGIERIGVLRALQLGDMLCATPALRSLRAAYPEARITLIGLPWAGWFASRYSDLIDETLGFPGWPGIPEAQFAPDRTQAFLTGCCAQSFDLAVQLHGSGLYTNTFVQQLGARQTAGFYPADSEAPGPGFIAYQPYGHESERLLRLPGYLGWPNAGDQIHFPLKDGDEAEYEALSQEIGLGKEPFAVVHAGARDQARRWPPEKFAAVADNLVRQGLRVLLTGVGSESEQVRAVADRMTRHSDQIIGRTSLGGLAALLQRAELLVSNDTGVAHIAAALDVPSAVIFTYSDPDRWAAPDERLHRRFVEPSALRFATSRSRAGAAPQGSSPASPRPVAVEEVIEAAGELLHT